MSFEVLVVEDESIIALDFQSILMKKDHNVKIVSSGESAIKEIENGNFDLVFMDVALNGDLDGIETAKIIKSKHPNIKIVFVSGSSNLTDMENINQLKPYKFISKPLKPKELEGII